MVRIHRIIPEALVGLVFSRFISASQFPAMLTCKPFQLSSSSRSPNGLRCQRAPCPAQLACRRPHSRRPSNVATKCCSSPPNDKPKSARQIIKLDVAGDLIINIGGGQPLEWDTVAISSAAKAALQQHGVKASTAHKMNQMLGFEDVDDLQRLTSDLISQLKLKPMHLEPLLNMLRERQGRQNAPLQQRLDQTQIKPPVELSGHGYMAFSSDGRRALSCNEDYELQVWDLATGTRIASLEGHEDCVMAVAITPDGRRAVSCSEDSSLRVWNLDTHTCIALLEGHTECVRDVAITPDERHAVSGSDDGTLRLWDLGTCVSIATLGELTSAVCSVAITPDGRFAVSGGDDCMLRLWDLATRACVATMEGHGGSVYIVAVTPDGRHAVSGSADKTLRIWDLDTHVCSATLKGHTDDISCMAVTPDGRHAVSGSEDNTLRVWDLATHACVATLEGHEDRVWNVVITPDGRYAASSTDDCTPRVWDLAAILGTARAAHTAGTMGRSKDLMTPYY